MKLSKFAAVTLLISTSGCGFFKTSDISVNSVPEHSALISDSNTKMSLRVTDPFVAGRPIWCVEPSPDTAANFERAFDALAKANITITPPAGQGGGAGGIDGQVKGDNKVTIEKLFDRTQGIQAIRDILFHSCIAVADGFITTREYHNIITASLQQNGALMAAEIAAKNGLGTVGNNEQQRLALLDFYKFVASASAIPEAERPVLSP